MRQKELVRRAVTGYCAMYIGDRTGPGRPHFDRKRRLWIVPVLCADGTRIGEISLDETLKFVEVNIEPAETEGAQDPWVTVMGAKRVIYGEAGWQPVTALRCPQIESTFPLSERTKTWVQTITTDQVGIEVCILPLAGEQCLVQLTLTDPASKEPMFGCNVRRLQHGEERDVVATLADGVAAFRVGTGEQEFRWRREQEAEELVLKVLIKVGVGAKLPSQLVITEESQEPFLGKSPPQCRAEHAKLPEMAVVSSPSLRRVSLMEYLALPRAQQEAFHLNAYRDNRDWVERTLAELKTEWLMVLGGEVVKSSRTLNDYPLPDELEQLAREHDEIPYVFLRDRLIEETPWSKTALGENDYYPTINVIVGAQDWNRATVQTSGIPVTADFDPGTFDLFFSCDRLGKSGIITIGSFDVPLEQEWLGRSFLYFVRRLALLVTTDTGESEVLQHRCFCVRNWQNSPFCHLGVNPNRQALVGRSLPLALGCIVELDFGQHTTRIEFQS